MMGTRRLISEVTPDDFGVSPTAPTAERIDAAVTEATRMARAGESPMLAASWCAEVLAIKRHEAEIHAAVEAEIDGAGGDA
jgi:hypothetical protein